MTAATQRWKNAEYLLAKIYNKYKLPATRKSRGANFSVSDYDVDIEGSPQYKSDSKYSIKGFYGNRLWDVVKAKYCKEPQDEAILFCKGYKEEGGKITLDVEFFACLLSYWEGKASKEELQELRYGKK